MPRKGRRSEATKKRWRTLDLEDLQGSQPDVAKPRTSPPTAQAWTPTQSPEKKVEGTPTERTRPARRQPRRAAPTLEVDAPAESSPVPLEDHVRDDSCQASSLEPCASGPPVQTVRATHCQADYRYGFWTPCPMTRYVHDKFRAVGRVIAINNLTNSWSVNEAGANTQSATSGLMWLF
ncbi:uncharacterized protein LOC124860652 isoform X4 [Girardinichthys multiradiatus]|uniref:uncharacterized protein LOC124860652 isoform X4 n=1 Tax=Girardinichthys multiradiatus TaxID=208333 RepID=UPI001FACCCFA|nr:uncharacterized protein LOC124860652 isoform X4 [Girardinichthys multiradiatus]